MIKFTVWSILKTNYGKSIKNSKTYVKIQLHRFKKFKNQDVLSGCNNLWR